MGDRLAGVLSARLEALASAAERTGADASAVGLLLEAASVATIRAVTLDLLLDDALPVRVVAAQPLGELRDAA